MVEEADQSDPWLMLEYSVQQQVEYGELSIEIIENVEPLDRQLGVWPKKTVPDTLHEIIFAHSNPTKTEIAVADRNPNATLSMFTYAILDGAKVAGLPEFLEGSGLEHRCLFKGEAYAELKDVAPWIVRLEDGNDFVRRLFTGSEGMNGLWENEPGIFVRSCRKLDEMWKHFRRFVRIRDDKSQWFYFRFWEPRVMSRYLVEVATDIERLARWGQYRSEPALSAILIGNAEKREFSCFDFPSFSDRQPRNHGFEIGELERSIFRRHQEDLFIKKLQKFLAAESPGFARLSADDQFSLCSSQLKFANANGLRIEKAVADFALADVVSSGRIRRDPICNKLLVSSDHQLDRAKKILTEASARLQHGRGF
ncbi:DUF4123 domain-containing protein [Paracoccus onubensis]|uniref:DUF4123 domain-containing protein n=1 Tax=Paracoccus onubensis TaxID=1675788 RepID=A0A418SN30_9RHOB|nr:DUF4123 domain-containing protein [Paracoccus onubensis]RJE82360.1 DUF4123 domain-containing protein [Paracoccus onubensis]